MKFTNGYWLVREGCAVEPAKQLYDYQIHREAVTLYLPCRKVEGHGATLNGAVITVEITSPLEDILHIRAWHHIGAVKNAPRFETANEKRNLEVTDDAATLEIRSGKTRAVIRKEYPYEMRYYYGEKELTNSSNGGLAWIAEEGGKRYMREELALDVGEIVYGLGERFTAFEKNGQVVDIWNEDGGTCSEQTYKNIPFYVTNKGYGVFVSHPEKVSFEVASEKVNRVQFSVEGELLDYYLIGGEQMKDSLMRYTSLTGKPTLPPAWSFGLWLSTSFVTSYDEETVMEFIDGTLSRGIPLDVFHFDCCWMEDYEWCNFEWNRKTFPNPVQMLKRIHERGVRVCVWINPYIGQKSPLFAEGMEHGYLLKRADGSVWQWDMWQAGMGIVDLTNPEAREWYCSKLEQLLDMGVDCFKTDFGERIPTDVCWFDGSDPQKMHNYYSYLYNETVFNLLEKKCGKGEAVLFARSATAGGQKFPVHWGGDCTSQYTSMAESLRGGLSFALSGFGYWSHDIGGFEDGCEPDIYKRWTQFGLLSSHSRYHGSGQYKVPWMYGEEAVAVTKEYTELKLSLMPYLYRCAVETSRMGLPMMRPMVLEFPEDETCAHLDRQYLLGDSLLVAPVFRADGEVRYYLPEGVWSDWFTGEAKEGGRWYTGRYDYHHLPLYVREGSIVVTGGKNCHSAEYDYTKDVTIHIFGMQKDGEIRQTLYRADGSAAGEIVVTRKDGKIEVTAPFLKEYQMNIVNC
ncbi:MAG: alpha-xylosidase [Candidatus Merdivicinus sp.]|jgi:alpha-D-xyloside xylohydrolase